MNTSYYSSVTFAGSSHSVKDGAIEGVNSKLDTSTRTIKVNSTEDAIANAIAFAAELDEDPSEEIASTIAGIEARFTLYATYAEAYDAAVTAAIAPIS